MLSIVREGGGGGTGGPNLPLPLSCIPGSHLFFPGFLPLVVFRLRNIKHCVISPTSRPLSSPAPISSPQMWLGVIASRCKEDHYLIPTKQIFVSRIFLYPVINQVNRSFRIENEAARVKSYLEKNVLSKICDTVINFFNIAKQYGLFELFPFCLLSL